MNLIEQLGGYEKAKRELQLKIDNSVLQCCMSVTADMIQEALLEHRRKNNIFEAGDKYTYLVDWDDSIDSIYSFDPIEWGDHLWNIENMIRHATDKEIAQGFRDE